MRKSLLKLLGVAAVLTWPAHAFAAGMGGIDVMSALGQELNAEVRLVAVSKEEKASLAARLASPEAYKSAGLDYPSANQFRFQIESRANGEWYIKVTSAQPIKDPFVSLLIELTWSTGGLVREYTFLLDPPGYAPEQPKPTEVQAVAPVVQMAPAAVEPAEQAAAAPVEERAVVAQQAPAAKKPASKAAAGSVATRPVAAKQRVQAGKAASVAVKRGDTLRRISAQNKPENVSLERMLVALYRANANQFEGNMNRIKVGKILRLPRQDELAKVTQAEALIEIRAQAEDWHAYRQKLASAVPAKQPQAARQAVTGKITGSVTDKAPVAKESATEVLRLSRGAAPGDNVGAGAGGKTVTAQEKKNVAQEIAISKAKTVEEEKGRTVMLEKNIKDAQRLAELKSAVDALSKSSSGVAASAVPAADASQPSLMERVLGAPAYLAGIVLALLGLGGLALKLKGRRKTPAGTQNAAADAAINASGSAGSAAAVASPTEPPVQSDRLDPLSEADLLLNFGRDAQAEEVLKEALRTQPGNRQVQLRLLDIYASRSAPDAFAGIARQLKDSGDAETWRYVAAMGRRLDPDNPLYGGNPLHGGGAIEDAASATVKMAAVSAAAIADDAQEMQPEVSAETGAVTPVEQVLPAQAVQSEQVAQAAETEPAEGEPIDFKLDFAVEKPAPAVQAAEEMLAGINLNLDDTAPSGEPKPESKNEHWHEVATKLDLARAYREMGDDNGAREILGEVMRDGDEGQKAAAQALLDQIEQ